MTGISVVIPMHNSQGWIQDTLQSVLAQTYPADKIETVIVDDGSQDDSVAVAQAFIARHNMRARIITCEHNQGVSAARNIGWRAATSDWIQFLDSDDILAPGKFEQQAALISRLADNVAVIYSSWQRLGQFNGEWRPFGETTGPGFERSVILNVATKAGYLGPALMRRQALEAVSGFSENVKYAEDSHLMLKLAAADFVFIEAPKAPPVFFIRQTPGSLSRRSRVNIARAHLANMVVAERLLREKHGKVSPEDCKEIGRLSGWALTELYGCDQQSFRHYLSWVRSVDLTFVPEHNFKLRIVSRLLGYENALRVARAYRRLRFKVHPAQVVVIGHVLVECPSFLL